jgi:hypothetical protein
MVGSDTYIRVRGLEIEMVYDVYRVKVVVV